MTAIRRCLVCGARRDVECAHFDCPNRRHGTAQPTGAAVSAPAYRTITGFERVELANVRRMVPTLKD